MATNFRDIKGAKKLKDQVKGLRTNLRKRITELSSKVLSVVELEAVTDEEVEPRIKMLNDLTIELQRLMTDEAAQTLIL